MEPVTLRFSAGAQPTEPRQPGPNVHYNERRRTYTFTATQRHGRRKRVPLAVCRNWYLIRKQRLCHS